MSLHSLGPSPVQFAGRKTPLLVAGLASLALAACTSGGTATQSNPPHGQESSQVETLPEDTYIPTAPLPDRVIKDCDTPGGETGKALACKTEALAREMNSSGFSAKSVNQAINDIYGVRVYGNASEMADQYREMKNKAGEPYFEEVTDYTPSELADSQGLVVVVQPGPSVSEYGDVFVTLGNGQIANDAVRPFSLSDQARINVFKPVLAPARN